MDNCVPLPCPFCGSEDIKLVHCEEGCCGARVTWVNCDKCGCYLDLDEATREDAIKVWNKRFKGRN
jgi:Lar family restriction alleviation protein